MNFSTVAICSSVGDAKLGACTLVVGRQALVAVTISPAHLNGIETTIASDLMNRKQTRKEARNEMQI